MAKKNVKIIIDTLSSVIFFFNLLSNSKLDYFGFVSYNREAK